MGCLCPKVKKNLGNNPDGWSRKLSATSRKLSTSSKTSKTFSWDQRPKVNVADYTISEVSNGTVGRLPGTVAGQQFIIESCQDATIYIFDHSAAVTIDDCTNCKIFLGPVKTSVFMRNCKKCAVMTACQQFRTRDCTQLNCFLLCTTKPIIESSAEMGFSCFQFYYPQLEEQLRSAGLNMFNNNWSSIFDFTQVAGVQNLFLLPPDVKVSDYIPAPTVSPFLDVGASTDPLRSVVPLTLGSRDTKSNETCLIVFFSDGSSHDRAIKFIDTMKTEHPEVMLIKTSEVTVGAEEVQRVFGSDSYLAAAGQGPVIGLELCGPCVIELCQEQLVTLTRGTTGLVFVSQNQKAATKNIYNFFNYSTIRMDI